MLRKTTNFEFTNKIPAGIGSTPSWSFPKNPYTHRGFQVQQIMKITTFVKNDYNNNIHIAKLKNPTAHYSWNS